MDKRKREEREKKYPREYKQTFLRKLRWRITKKSGRKTKRLKTIKSEINLENSKKIKMAKKTIRINKRIIINKIKDNFWKKNENFSNFVN